MSDPAIRAALRAGGEAARKEAMRAGWCWHDRICEAAPCACCAVVAAAAVAAFLRALPVGLPTADSPTPYRIARAEQRDAWAAAVEAAAKERGG